MDINETIHELTPFDDEDRRPRRDARQVLACFAVCGLAAVAVFLVARSDHQNPEAAAAGVAATTSSVASSHPRDEESADDGDDATLFEELFGDRLEDFTEPSDGSMPDSPSQGSGGGNAAAVDGHSFTLDHPNGWNVSTEADGYQLGSPDDAAGVGVGVVDTPPDGYRFEQWANEWEALTRAQLMQDLEVVERGAFNVNGLEGFRVRYVGSVEGERLAGEMWWLGDGEMVWLLNQVFPADDVELSAACDSIARSFRPADRA